MPYSHRAATRCYAVSGCRSATDFKCKNNLCLPSSVRCDGYDHCGDGSDEAELCGTSAILYLIYVSFPRSVYQPIYQKSLAIRNKYIKQSETQEYGNVGKEEREKIGKEWRVWDREKNTHTHRRLTAFFQDYLGMPALCRYQKDRPFWILLKQR